MTPEEARGLLAHVEGTDAAVLMAHMDWKDVAEALETIANLRYEYAVQISDCEWVRENDEGQFVLTFDPMSALRHCHPRIAAKIAEAASAQFGCECRVVRRLVSDVEVVE